MAFRLTMSDFCQRKLEVFGYVYFTVHYVLISFLKQFCENLCEIIKD